jgi:hypothetical protein
LGWWKRACFLYFCGGVSLKKQNRDPPIFYSIYLGLFLDFLHLRKSASGILLNVVAAIM